MKMAMCIGFGGMLGTLGRYGLGLWLNSMMTMPGLTTFAVNVMGSFLIGWTYGIGMDRLGPQLFGALTIGFLGGFTTYSAFSNEAFQFFKEGRIAYALGYMAIMFVVCLLATAGGYKLAA